MTLTRADGQTIVTVRPTVARLLRAMLPFLIVLFCGLALILPIWLSTRKRSSDTEAALVVIGVALMFGLLVSFGPVLIACFAQSWVGTSEGFTFNGRTLNSVQTLRFPKLMIADLRVVRLRTARNSHRRLCLAILRPDGQYVIVTYGRRAELNFLCQSLRQAMGLGDDPMNESDYPPLPTWKWKARVARGLLTQGVILEWRPPRVGWFGVAATVVLLPAAVVVGNAVFAAGYFTGVAVSPWAVGRDLLLGSLASALAMIARFSLGRRVLIGVTPAVVELSERSLLRPGLTQWPRSQVTGVELRPSGRRFELVLGLIDGSPTPLVAGLSEWDGRFLRNSLSVALARSVSRPIQSPATPPGETVAPSQGAE